MGFAIAEELAEQGAKVTLVAGPVQLGVNHPNVNRIDVESALQMKEACMKVFPTVDGAIMCAAVADYKPRIQANEKIKRTQAEMSIELEATDDIAATLGKIKTGKQVLVGFALETQNEMKNAGAKMEKKNLDFIVLNSLKDKGAGFGVDTNKITIIGKDNKAQEFKLKMKAEVARDIVEKMIDVLGDIKTSGYLFNFTSIPE